MEWARCPRTVCRLLPASQPAKRGEITSQAAAYKAGGTSPQLGLWAGGRTRVLSCGHHGAGACQPHCAIVLLGELPRALGCSSWQERQALPSETCGIGWRTRPPKKITMSSFEPHLPPLAEGEGRSTTPTLSSVAIRALAEVTSPKQQQQQKYHPCLFF